MAEPNNDLHKEQEEEHSIFDDIKPLPVYYSEHAVYAFTVFFGVLFGSVLMAINFKQAGARKAIVPVLAFGVLYTIVVALALYYVPNSNTALGVAINLGGALILKYFFWQKYIGKNAVYHNKPIWGPMIAGILLFGIIVAALFFAIYPDVSR